MHTRMAAWLLAFISLPLCAAEQTPKELYDEVLRLEQAGVNDTNLALSSTSDSADAKAYRDRLANEASDALNNQLRDQSKLEELAKGGSAEAAYWAGMLEYHEGERAQRGARGDANMLKYAEESFGKAIGWWKPLVERGYSGAQAAYGTAYAEGRGVPQSPSNAIELWYKAATTFSKAGDREDALTLYDMMRKLDPSNPYVTKLQRALYPPDQK